MIDLSMRELFLLYLLAVLAVVGLSWLRTVRRARRARRLAARDLVGCRACGNRFTDSSAAELPRCPHCGRPAERGGLGTV